MARNDKDRILINSSEYYKPLRKSRNAKIIEHFETPRIYHPTVRDRSTVISEAYIWKYGDRYYKLAYDYYGDQNLWWIIAWYNGYPTEAAIENGSVIEIPVDLEQVSRVLGV
tara:strand:+ start:1371 stop:1706 length:336 start_codon:yes stop_codon:yes gene_type:complete